MKAWLKSLQAHGLEHIKSHQHPHQEVSPANSKVYDQVQDFTVSYHKVVCCVM